MSHPVLERLTHADPAQRRSACAEAADDPSALLLLPTLCAALGDPDKRVGSAAADALCVLNPRLPEVTAALREALHGGDARRRWGAAQTLARLAPPSPRLIPVLVEALDSPDGDVRWSAARLLVDAGRLHDEVRGVVLGLLGGTDSNPRVQRMAAFCLRELAPDDPAAAGALVRASRSDDRGVRRAAFNSLAALSGLPDPLPVVTHRLREARDAEPDPECRRLAQIALDRSDAAARPGVPARG